MTEQALVVAGHGSHRNPDSSTPVHRAVEAIRERGSFAEVRPAFWKEAPSIRNVLHTVDADEAIVVPLFVSEGYFVDQVLPREFALGEADRAGGNLLGDEPPSDDPLRVRYADPIGTHPAMTDVISARARRMLDDDPAEPGETALAVIGHGTERNPNSADAIYSHVEALRDRGTFAEVGALFMDEAPSVEDAREQFDADELAVVPLFAADGFHTQDEIPELLGLTDEPRADYPVPGTVGDRRIWYSSAVGTDPLVVDVVLERAEEAGANLDAAGASSRPVREEAGEAFVSWVESEGATVWGELAVTQTESNEYELRHREDRDAPTDHLDALALGDLRETVRDADDGRYRPFAGEETLPTGWVCSGLDRGGLLGAVSTVYPAGVEHWATERAGNLEPVPFRAVADRQTGIYDCVADLSREELERTVEACCGNCAKRREWAESEGEDPESLGDDAASDSEGGDLPCCEPCSFLVAAGREFLQHERDGTETATDESHSDRPDAAVPRGDLTDPANVYRVRYRRASGVSDTPNHDRRPEP
ncbi:CbiX/SirB N-terminal domain-containing protein [Halorussus lipolyticus]|uniref:CbiX/SirB N-terminal domain-containing protein n=1 Tax=Halorussus lipolyticus TaxID=3034024 RepID=UPI0023E7FD67|nr:CbiX/SirB N-terminal domain-containing protein [Halorussus sp. DT80]